MNVNDLCSFKHFCSLWKLRIIFFNINEKFRKQIEVNSDKLSIQTCSMSCLLNATKAKNARNSSSKSFLHFSKLLLRNIPAYNATEIRLESILCIYRAAECFSTSIFVIVFISLNYRQIKFLLETRKGFQVQVQRHCNQLDCSDGDFSSSF